MKDFGYLIGQAIVILIGVAVVAALIRVVLWIMGF